MGTPNGAPGSTNNGSGGINGQTDPKRSKARVRRMFIVEGKDRSFIVARIYEQPREGISRDFRS